ncbi:MAG: putative transposase, partial [Gammaproteobacteria bacterium]
MRVWVREIRKLTKSGHQTACLCTDYRSALAPLACAMFARWSVSFRQVCGGAVRSSLAEIPVRLSRRRIRARTVRERTAIWPAG